ncbi:hypothetical protein C0995_000602 [Termitomyces sp. Mi166|nr:hypothetical protein C0995_000602 [Termitomyces sp. Mi166\
MSLYSGEPLVETPSSNPKSANFDEASVMNALNGFDREGKLCRSYNCCGTNFPDIHALLEHFEDVHFGPATHAQRTVPFNPQPIDSAQPPFEADMELDFNNFTPPAPPSVSHSSPYTSPRTSPCTSQPPSPSPDATTHPQFLNASARFSADYIPGLYASNGEEIHVNGTSDFATSLNSAYVGQMNPGVPPIAQQQSLGQQSIPAALPVASGTSIFPNTSNTSTHTPAHIPLPAPSLLLSKPFRCPNPNCNKSYRQANGLKYHLTHGSCNLAPPKDLEHIKDLPERRRRQRSASFGARSSSDPTLSNAQPPPSGEVLQLQGRLGTTETELRDIEREAEKQLKPFACGVGDCRRRYKNMNGLRYHYQHSGDHRAVGLALLAGGLHECLGNNRKDSMLSAVRVDIATPLGSQSEKSLIKQVEREGRRKVPQQRMLEFQQQQQQQQMKQGIGVDVVMQAGRVCDFDENMSASQDILAEKREKVMTSLNVIFHKVQHYRDLLSCREGDAQKVLDAFQTVYAREAILWAQLSHPNILPFYGLVQLGSRLSFVSRWATNGNLEDYLAGNPGATYRLLLCLDTAAGVEYLHKNDIVHGDLKGLNVLIDSSGRAALGDFGLASVTDPQILKWSTQSSIASKGGTARWQAPELLPPEDTSEKVYNSKESDVFAWANVCYEIFTGHHPYYEITKATSVMLSIMQGKTPTRPQDGDPAWLEHGLNDRIWDLMKDCWNFQPSERPNMTIVVLRLDSEKPLDSRPPGEWAEKVAMHFRNAQNAELVRDMLPFWEELESLLSRIVSGI